MKLGNGNIIKFFSEMAKGAKMAASSVDDSAGTIKKALAGISGGAKGAWSSIGTFGKIGLVVAGISLVVGAVQKYKAHMEELRQEAANAANEFADSQSSMDDYASRITELRNALAEGTLTESEAYQAKKELYDIQSQLNDSYGSAAGGIDLVNGKLDDQIEKLKQLTLLNAQQYLNENKSEIDKATREMTKTLGGDGNAFAMAGEYLGLFYNNMDEDTQKLREIIDKYSNLETDDMGDGTIRIRFVGDATQAKSVLNDFMTDLRAADEEFGGDSYLFQDMFSGASSIYNQADKIIEKYQGIYEEALRAKMIEESYSANQKTYGNGNNAQTAAKWLDDYTNAVQAYNDALSSGDSTQIADARSEFEQLDSVIQSLLADKDGLGYFVPMFSNVAGALNQSAIAAQHLRETIKRSQEADGLQRSGMTQSEFAEAFVNGLGTDETSRSVKYLLEQYANEYGIEFSKMTTDQVEAAAKFFADMGVLIKDVADSTTSDTLETLKKSSTDTINAISGIQNAQNALASQEAGKSISPSDFASDELKDFASALEYVNGVYQLNAEKVNAIVEAKANEQIAINDTNKAYDQAKYVENARQIEKYRKELEAAKESGDSSAKTIEDNINALLAENASLKSNCEQYDLMSAALAEATGAYQNWINAKSAGEAGDMFDSALEALKQIDDTLNNSDSDLFGRVGRTDYKAAVDFVIPDTIDKEDSDAVNSYLQSISDMFTYDSNGNKSGLNVWNFIDKSLQNGLLVEDGDVYRVAGEKSMKDFADGLGLALPLVRAMFGELEEFGAKFDWSDEAHKTFGDLVVAATDAADTLREKLGDKYQLSIDVSDASKGLDTVDKQVTYLDKTIADMQDAISKKETIGLDDSEVVAAQDVIRAAVAQKQLLTEPDIMKVDTSLVEGKLGEALTVLQRFQEAKNALEEAQKLNIGVDEAKAELESATQAVQDLDASVTSPKVLNIDTTSVDSIAESLQNLTAELIVKAGVDDKAILGYTPDTKSATVKYSVDRRAVDAFNPPNLTRYVTYHATMEGASGTNWQGGSKGSGGGGRVNGSANAYGSARVGTAKLQGDWRAHAGRSLVGELGREIIVDPNTGRWYTVGDKGAEFVNIPEGAIIFNHRQSDALLENGRVAGRGQSYASGSAFVTGYIPSGIKNNGSSTSGRNPGYSNPNNGASSSVDDNYDKKLETFDWIEVAIDRIERVIERLGKVADSTFKSLKSRMNAASDEISMVTREIDLQQRAYDKYMSAAESVSLSSNLKELVRNGAIDISQYDEDTTKLINDYKDLYDKALDCSTAIDDLHESLAQLYKDKFDNIQGNYNNKLSLLEKQSDSLQRKIDKLEEQGYLQNANFYAQMQDVERQNIQTLTQELAALNRAFDEAMASGEIEEGSDAWYEMKISIEDTKAAIDDAELSIIKYANSIRQISWDYFDYGQERISQITAEASFLQSLLDGKDMYDGNGNLSDAGTASMGLHAESYGVYMAQADKYADEIKKINKELASDPNNKDLIARRDELLSSQRDSILAAKDEKEAMIDLAKNGIQVELDAVRELIDAYMDSLDSAKDLYDYQKKIAEKTANISALEKQLAAYQNDMSEEARSKIQKIQLELKDAQDDLKDTEYDRFVSDAKKALDSMYDEYEDLLNSRFDDVDALFEKLIGTVNDNYADINEYISKAAGSVGYTITEATSSLWANGGSANGLVSAYGTDISTKLTSVGLTVENIFSVLEGIARTNGVPFSTTKSYKSGGLVDYTGIANVHGSEDKPEMVLNAADTKNFILLRDAMRSGALNSMFGAVRIGSDLSKVGVIDAATIDKVDGSDGYTVGSISVSIPIAHVDDYSDFVNQLRDDKQFEQFIQDVTIGKIAGKNSLSKNRHKW